MADGYWNPQTSLYSSAGLLKRPRADYENGNANQMPPEFPRTQTYTPPSGMSLAHGMHNYLARDDDHGGHRMKDTKTIGSAYDRYLQNTQLNSTTSGEASDFGGVGLRRDDLPSLSPTGSSFPGRSEAVSHDLPPIGRDVGEYPMDMSMPMPLLPPPIPSREILPLPRDASNTLYVEGLPSDCSRREVAHIFRPFVGYKEVRLVSKESKHRGGDPLTLCFVDFINPACAATAMGAIQGYKMDEHESDSAFLRLQFSKHPGPRSGSGVRGRR